MKITSKARKLLKDYNTIKTKMKLLELKKKEIESYFTGKMNLGDTLEVDNKYKLTFFQGQRNTLDKNKLMNDYDIKWNKYTKTSNYSSLRLTILK